MRCLHGIDNLQNSSHAETRDFPKCASHTSAEPRPCGADDSPLVVNWMCSPGSPDMQVSHCVKLTRASRCHVVSMACRTVALAVAFQESGFSKQTGIMTGDPDHM